MNLKDLFNKPEDEELDSFGTPITPDPVPLPVPQPQPMQQTSQPGYDMGRDIASKKRGLSVIDGIAQIFGAKAGSTDGTKQDLDKSLADSQKFDLDKYTRGRQSNQDAIDAEKLARGTDPKRDPANLYRSLVTKQLLAEAPEETHAQIIESLKGMGLDDLKGLYAKAGGGQIRRYSPAALEGPDGKTIAGTFDSVTGEYADSNRIRAWANKTMKDPITNENIITSGSGQEIARPGSASVPGGSSSMSDSNAVVPRPGESPANFNARLEQYQKAQNSMATEIGKSEAQLADAEAFDHDFLEVKTPRWKDMHALSLAAQSGGPLTSRMAMLAQKFGFSPDEAGAQLREESALWGNEYINRITGAAMAMEEFRERFQPILIQQGDTPPTIHIKLKGLANNLKEHANKLKLGSELKKKRLQEGVLTPRNEGPTKKTVVKKMYSASTDKTKIVFSDNTEEVVDGRQ